MQTQISITRQHDLFEVVAPRWEKLPANCREDLKALLTQLFIEAIHKQSIIQTQEHSHASENQAEPFAKDRVALPSPIESAATP
jgi:hypothetical protein